MSLGTPFGFAALALAGPLLLWYVLRSRRPRVPVSSTFLWAASEDAATAALPWQRFRPDATFWLALVALTAGSLALARPTLPVEAPLGDHTILMLDASASMSADEDGTTRLALTRRQAHELVERLGPGQTMSVVEAAGRARVVLSASQDPGALRRALAAVQASQGPADLSDAFTLAAALQRPGQSTIIHLFTDGQIPAEHAAAAPPGLRVTAVGQDRGNLALTRLQAVPLGAGSAQVFARVRNFGVLPAQARVSLSTEDAELHSRRIDLLPRGSADLVADVELPPGDGGPAVLRAAVEPVGGAAEALDALALDNAAYTVVTGNRTVVALVAGPGNVFANSALAAVEGVEVRTAQRVPDDLTGVDLLVIDRVEAPEQPTLPTLMIAPSRPPEGVTLAESVSLPAVTFQEPGHELLRDVDLSQVAIVEAWPVDAPALQTVAGGPDGSLIAAGRLSGQPVVHLAFDLMASSLPLDVAWPVLAANSVAWLTGPPTGTPIPAGSEVVLAPPPGVTAVEVTSPSGEEMRLDAAAARLRADQVGIWRPRWVGAEEVVAGLPTPAPIAVNAVESEGDLSRDPPAPAGEDSAEAAARAQGQRVIGPGLLAAVLGLLLAEWVYAHGWMRFTRGWRRSRRGRARRGARRATPDAAARGGEQGWAGRAPVGR